MSYQTLNTNVLHSTLAALLRKPWLQMGVGFGALAPVMALANPTGGNVVGGHATITAPNANNTVIDQTTQKAIINWQSFNIGGGQLVQFVQPSSSSVVLNRVIGGGGASSIFGNLTANGQVFLINTSGILFGRGAQLDVQGIVASSLDMRDSDFLGGNYVFTKGSGAASASVINQGTVSARPSGYVVLAGDYAENDGLIAAKSGHVVLAAGNMTTLGLSGNRLVSFAVNQATLAQLAGVSNTGTLSAFGGSVLMTADVANQLRATVVNNSGLVQANSVYSQGGAIYLTASGGDIQNSGTLDASAQGAHVAGGQVVLKTDGLLDLTAASKIDAVGANAKGGEIDLIAANARYGGAFTAGQHGTLLVDPATITIKTGNGGATNTFGTAQIDAAILAGTGIDVSAGVAGVGGNITNSVAATLIKSTGTGTLTFTIGQGGTIALSGLSINVGGSVVTAVHHGTATTAGAVHATESFGRITAKAADIEAGKGKVVLHGGSVAGSISLPSIRTTVGNVVINANNLTAVGGSKGLELSAAGNLSINSKAVINNAGSGTNAGYSGAILLKGKNVTYTHKMNTFAVPSHEHDITVSATSNATLGAISAEENGNITITAGNNATAVSLNASDDGHPTGGSITVTAGNLVKLGSAGFSASQVAAHATKNLTLSGKGVNYEGPGGPSKNFVLKAGKNLTVKGGIGEGSSVRSSVEAGIRLSAGGAIKLDHNAHADGIFSISGAALSYTGNGATFKLTNSNGNMILSAPIGTPTAPANYNVKLANSGGSLFVHRSIYTGNTAHGAPASINISQTGGANNSLHPGGILIGNRGSSVEAGAVNLITRGGPVEIVGKNVTVGHGASTSYAGAVSIAANPNGNTGFVFINATGVPGSLGTYGGVTAIEAGAAFATGNGTASRDINILAGRNVDVDGAVVKIKAGQTQAVGNAVVTSSISLVANNNVTVKGGAAAGDGVSISGGRAIGTASAAGDGVIAFSRLRLVAGNNVTVEGRDVKLTAGQATANVKLSHAGSADAFVHGDLRLLASNSVNVIAGILGSGSAVTMNGGVSVGGTVLASGSKAKAGGFAIGQLFLRAANAVNVTGDIVTIHGGNNLAKGGSHLHGIPDVGATHGGSAAFLDNAGVVLRAGTGNVTVTGSGAGVNASVVIGGGSNAGSNLHVAAGSHGKVLDSASAGVKFLTGGDVVIKSKTFTGFSSGNESGAEFRKTNVSGNSAGSARLLGNVGVAVNARNITVSAASVGTRGYVSIHGRHLLGTQDSVHVGSGGKATATLSGRVDLTATGNLVISATRNANITAGFDAASGAHLRASSSGQATLTADAGLGLTGANVSISGKSVSVQGGRDAGALNVRTHRVLASSSHTASGGTHFKFHNVLPIRGSIHASSSAAATLNADAAVNIKATGGNVNVTGAATGASNSVFMRAGSHAGAGMLLSASGGGHAALNANTGIQLSATGNVNVFGRKVQILGGNSDGGTIAGTSFNTHFINHYKHSTGTHSFGTSGRVTTHFKTTEITGSGGGKVAFDANAGIAINAGNMVKLRASGSTGGSLRIEGGRNGMGGASIQAGPGGSAQATVNTGVQITTKVLDAFAPHGSLGLFAGSGGAANARVSAQSGSGHAATATVNVNQDLSVTAASASLSAHGNLNIGGGEGNDFGVQVSATDQATATVTTHASDSIAVAGNFTAAAGGNLNVAPAFGVGFRAKARALGAGAKASIDGSASVAIAAANETFTAGGSLSVRRTGDAGDSAQLQASSGGKATLQLGESVILRANTNLGLTAVHGLQLGSYGGSGGFNNVNVKANGAGAAADAVDTEKLRLKAATVSLTGSNVALFGAYRHGVSDRAHASNGALASLSSTGRTEIQANTLTATATNLLQIRAGDGGDASAQASAQGAGAKVSVSGDARVALSATSMILSAGANLDVSGGWSAAHNAAASGNNGGSASLRDQNAVQIATTGGLNLGLSNVITSGGGIVIAGGRADGSRAAARASHGQATLVTSDGAALTGASVFLRTRGRTAASVSIHGGNSLDHFARASAQSAGVATLTGANGVNIAATGALRIKANNGRVTVGGGNGQAVSAAAGGFNSGAKATLTANGDVNLTGSSVSFLGGKSHSADLFAAGSRDGHSARASAAQGGIANLTTTNNLNITATKGALTVQSGFVEIRADNGASDGRSARAIANVGGAQATVTVNGNVTLTGARSAVFNATNGGVSADGGFSSPGYGGRASASHGTAKTNIAGSVTITTPGLLAFTGASSGESLAFFVGREGAGASVNAKGSATKAAVNGNYSINLSGNRVSLSGRAVDMSIETGLGESNKVFGRQGGSASASVNGTINVTAAKGISAKLIGTGSGAVKVKGGRYVGDGAKASASSGAVATVTAKGDVNLTVTGAGGSIDLSAGKQHGSGSGANQYALGILAGSGAAGEGGIAEVRRGGKAALTASGNVNLTAPGAITLIAPHGNVLMGGQHSVGRGAEAVASYGGGAQATLAASGNLTIRGASVAVSAGTYTTTSAGTAHLKTHHAGNLTLQAGTNSNGHSAEAIAHQGGSATATVNNQTSITASNGALTFNAANGLQVAVTTGGSNGKSARASASLGGAQATLNLNETLLLSGANGVSLLAVGEAKLFPQGSSNLHSAHVFASHQAQANLNQTASLTIKSAGDVNITAGTSLDVSGAGSLAENANVQARGVGAKAAYTATGTVNISGNNVNLKGGTFIDLRGGFSAGRNGAAKASNGGSAQLGAVADVNITAAKNVVLALTNSGEGIDILAGNSAGRLGLASGNKGKAGFNASANVNITATAGTLTVSNPTTDPGEQMNIGGGSDVGNRAHVLSSYGGSATMTVNDNVNLTAAGAVTINAGSYGGLNIHGAGSSFAGHNGTGSGSITRAIARSGKASLSMQSLVNIGGSAVTLNAGKNLNIFGGGASSSGPAAARARALGSSSGSAKLSALTAVDIIATKGALTATAGGTLRVQAGGSDLANHALASANGAGARATLTAGESVQLSGGNITLIATGGPVLVRGASNAATYGGALASHNVASAHAALNVTGTVGINATGNLLVLGAHGSSTNGVSFTAGGNLARSARAIANGSGASAAITGDTGINIVVGGNFKARASAGSLGVFAGGNVGRSDLASAGRGVPFFNPAGKAAINLASGVNIAVGGNVLLVGHSGLVVAGGSSAARNDGVLAALGGSAAVSTKAGVNITAGGSFDLYAPKGNAFVGAGSRGGSSGFVHAHSGAKATLTVDGGAHLKAAGAMSGSASGNFKFQGGGGASTQVVSSYGGSAVANVDTSLSVKTGGNLIITAGGSLQARAGGFQALFADLHSFAHGTNSDIGHLVKGTVNTSVDLEAGGSANLMAGKNLEVAAAQGALLAVGKFRTNSGLSGSSWQGGSASLNGNFSATLKAAKNLTLTAGTTGVGSLAVDALQAPPNVGPGFRNTLSVRGGSSQAHAKLTLNGNATVTAGNNMVINANGNAGVYAGSVGNVRVYHDRGSASVNATADATLKAGGNVTFNKVTGGLTVAGIGVNASHAGFVVGEAFGSGGEGRVAIATVHADALVSAGGSITTVTNLGGDFALVAANSVTGFVLGPTRKQSATVTGNANLVAGKAISIDATGNVNVLGGARALDSVAQLQFGANFTDVVQARTGFKAGTNLNLVAGGNLLVAAGDGLLAAVSAANVSFAKGVASADASASLQAGGTLNLGAGGHLLVRGGSGDLARGFLTAAGTHHASHGNAEHDTLTMSANGSVTLTAGGNLTVAAGTAGANSATFEGGSAASGWAIVRPSYGGHASFDNATATANANLTLNTGGNLTITGSGPINIIGGPLTESIQSRPSAASAAHSFGGAGIANNDRVTTTITGAVQMKATGNVSVTAATGNVTMAGGSGAAGSRNVIALGSRDTVGLTVDASVTITGGKAVSVTATAGNVDISAGRQSSASSRFIEAKGSHAKVAFSANSGVSVGGATLVITGTDINLVGAPVATRSSGTLRTNVVTGSGGTATAVQISGVTLAGAPAPVLHGVVASHGFGSGTSHGVQHKGGIVKKAAAVVAPQSHVSLGGSGLHVGPAFSTTSFGGRRAFTSGLDLSIDTPSTSLSLPPQALVLPVSGNSLGDLQSLSLVTSLVTVANTAALNLVPLSAVQLPAYQPALQQAPAATLFTPVSVGVETSLSSNCLVGTFADGGGAGACSVGMQ